MTFKADQTPFGGASDSGNRAFDFCHRAGGSSGGGTPVYAGLSGIVQAAGGSLPEAVS